MQITSQGWIAIGLFVATVIVSAVAFYYKKRMTRLEALETAVFGADGVNKTLHKYVTHEVLERRLGDFAASMKGISEEGTRREERIIDAIQSQTLVLSAQISEIKNDVRTQSARIDHVITNTFNNR